MFKSTLVHEFGHNLGLRHNFLGSMDKANFYQQDETTELGYDKPPAYSSIMDYAASSFDELPVYGKYDVAALRFGYSREIEVIVPMAAIDEAPVSKFVSLADADAVLTADHKKLPSGAIKAVRDNLATTFENSPEASLKTYQFCTDEHTTTSPTCNRFDEGTDILEVTKFRIQRYHDSYETMNKRDGRDSFYQYHLFYYTLNRAGQFTEIRDVIEQVEAIDAQFSSYLGVVDSQGAVFSEIYEQSCQRYGRPLNRETMSPSLRNLCTMYDATKLAADFFVGVMTQPDKVCELVELSGEDDVENRVRFDTLSNLWRTYGRGLGENKKIPTTCFDKDLEAELKNQANEIIVRSETRDGRIQASLQANNPYQSTASSVDLLGSWPDKLLAAQMLVKRDSQYVSVERSNIALIDIDDTYADVLNHISYLVGDDRIRQAKFIDRNGEYKPTIHRYTPAFSDKIDAVPDYLWQMKRFLLLTERDNWGAWYNPAVPNAPTPYFAALLNNIITHGQANEYGLSDSAQGLVDALTLTKAGPGVDLKDAVTFSWKSRNYVASRRNTMAQAMAKRALYTPETMVMVEALNNLSYRVRNTISLFNDTVSNTEAEILAIGNKETLELFNETTGFARMFLIRKRFKSTTDENGVKCYRLEVEDETDLQHAARKCNSKKALELVLTKYLPRIQDEKRLEELYDLAQKYGDDVVTNSNHYSKSVTKHNHVYAYPANVLRSWSSRDYVNYRKAFQQVPIR
ncbi:MAG: zinc-dependent metalloprotease [Psychrobium sp.]|nr:zinc-dependent metalloprotease [Psychrobium sp.]